MPGSGYWAVCSRCTFWDLCSGSSLLLDPHLLATGRRKTELRRKESRGCQASVSLAELEAAAAAWV